MGTTNRAFTPSLHKAMMLNHASMTGKRYLSKPRIRKNEVIGKQTVFNKIKSFCESVFRFFGFGKEVYVFPVAKFSTPMHSAHLCGKRTDEQRAKRKARRQKRTKLIMRRGYA